MSETKDYYADERLSRSDLALLLDSPSLFKLIKIDKSVPSKHTLGMENGSIFHMALLEPERIREEYTIFENYVMVSRDWFVANKGRRHWAIVEQESNQDTVAFTYKDGKAVYEALKELYQTEKIILPETWQNIKKQMDGLKFNSIVNDQFTGEVKTEVEAYGVIEDLEMKCRIDAIRGNLLMDYKTGDKSISSLLKEREPGTGKRNILESKMWSEGLDMQYYIYTTLYAQANDLDVKDLDFKFVIQHNASNGCAVIAPGKDIFDLGKRRTHRAIELFHQCQATDIWPDFIDHDGNTNLDHEFKWSLGDK